MAFFSNYATLSYTGRTVVSNTVSGEIQEAVSAVKTSLAEAYSPGEHLTYVLSLLNSGAMDATGLTVADDLGGYSFEASTVYPLAYVPGSLRYYINGTLQSPTTVTDGPPLTIQGINIPAGGNTMLIYEAEVTEYAPPGPNWQITNTASVSGGWLSAPVTASATIASRSGANLTIHKELTPETVVENGQITYIFKIENTGTEAAEAADSVVLTDIFHPVLNPIAVTYNDTNWTEGVQYTYSPATGLLTTAAGQITVPAAVSNQRSDGTWELTPGTVVVKVTGTV